MCLHVFILLLKSPSFLVEIRGGAISKGNGEGDSLKGLLQEFPFLYFSTFIICGSKIQSKILPFHFLTFSCSLIYILYRHISNSSHKGYGDMIFLRLDIDNFHSNSCLYLEILHGCPCHICEVKISVLKYSWVGQFHMCEEEEEGKNHLRVIPVLGNKREHRVQVIHGFMCDHMAWQTHQWYAHSSVGRVYCGKLRER